MFWRRNILLVIVVALGGGCATTSPPPDAEAIVKLGRISERSRVSVDEARSRTAVNTNIYASVSSGGGISIGLGFLLSPFRSDDLSKRPIRYRIDLLDGDRMTVYHDDPDYGPGDCVEIRVYRDGNRYPPSLRRKPGAC